MQDEVTLNQRNWESLIALYEHVAASDEKFTRISKPFVGYLSDHYDWPNFVVIDAITSDFEERVAELSSLISTCKNQPYVLCHPLLAQNMGVAEVFEKNNMRQFDQWINILYDIKWGLPADFSTPGFRTEIVANEEQKKIWADITSTVFHHGRPVPVNSLTGDKFMLLIGYADDVPVATMMIFFDREITTTYYGAVLKEYRGKGYGQKILRVAFEEMKKLGIELSMSQSTQAGIKSWLQFGYQTTGYIDIFMKLGTR